MSMAQDAREVWLSLQQYSQKEPFGVKNPPDHVVLSNYVLYLSKNVSWENSH